MDTNVRPDARASGRLLFPIDDAGQPIEPNPHFDDWDVTPHAYFTVGVGHVQLGDVVLGGTHQVEGFGRSEQRGTEARRFDLQYVVARSMEYSARLILPLDHLLEVKRYTPDIVGKHRWAWVKLPAGIVRNGEEDQVGEVVTYKAGLVPDYGKHTASCCCKTHNEPVNADGYEVASTMCDDCVESWETDHEVVRHFA